MVVVSCFFAIAGYMSLQILILVLFENKYKNPSPIVEMATNNNHYQPIEEPESYPETTNEYSQDEEDALFDALFNL